MTSISHVTLELAREPSHPQGDRDHSYHLYLPLNDEGRIDAESWKAQRARCRVRRFRPGEAEARGHILHGPGGRWYFDYNDATSQDDEQGIHLEHDLFAVGEYASIREDDGKTHTFQVVSVRTE